MASKSCSVASCVQPFFKNGYCVDHYRQYSGTTKLGQGAGGAAESQFAQRFKDLAAGPCSDQLQLFLKSFIFDLGDNWKEVVNLENRFKKRCNDSNEVREDLNPVMAADFLQKNGLERTALQRKEEVADIDLDHNDRISFIEYLLLHYKVMILQAYYKRTGLECKDDFSRGGIGVTGVGAKLLEELFTFPLGLDPELERAIEEFTTRKKERESKVKDLSDKQAMGGVKGLAAGNELKQIESADQTEMNRIEITLNAAKKRSAKDSGEVALKKRQEVEAQEAEAKRAASRNALKAKASTFEAK